MSSETFPSIRLAGLDGRVSAYLSERTLLLERRDGKGMKIELDSISRLRHHNIAVSPPLFTLFGIVSIIAGWRVLDGRPQVYSIILGCSAILVWALARRPALCVDTRQGDRHILYGRDHRLQRMYIMLDRMTEGETLEDARAGLDELSQPEFNELGSIEDIHEEFDGVVAAEQMMEPQVVEPISLSAALADVRKMREGGIGEPVMAAEIIEDESAILEPEVETDTISAGQHSFFQRAKEAMNQQREGHISEQTPAYESPWQQPDETQVSAYERTWGRPEPEWYNESSNSEETAPTNYQSEQQTEDFGFGGGMFGIFDAADALEEKPSQQTPTTQTTSNQWSRTPSSYSMLSAAVGPSLPEPTRTALRDDIPTQPGLVATARLEMPPSPAPVSLISNTSSLTNDVGADPLNDYPALRRMRGLQGRDARLRVTARGVSSRSALSAIGEWMRPGLRRIEQTGKQALSLLKGSDADDYSETYGDVDIDEETSLHEEMRSSQLLRLRSDQDAQSDVAERLRILMASGSGEIADDLAARTLKGISSSSSQISGVTNQIESPPRFEALVCSSSPEPGFQGMRRLG